MPKQNIEISLDFNTKDFYFSYINFKHVDTNIELYPDIKYNDSYKSISLYPLKDIF